MSDNSRSPLSASSSGGTSRRRLLAVIGAGGAAVVASQLPRKDALAGHDGTNVLHLGEQNTAPVGKFTQITADADAVLLLHNDNPAGGA